MANSSKKNSYKIEIWDVEKVIPYDRNPRKNEHAVEAVAKSLQEFGFKQPVVVDKDGVVIVGHTRLKAAISLGLKKIPIHIAEDLTAEQVKAYRIADNQTATIADWDIELLPIELAELQDAGFDMGLLAFDEDELAKLLKTEPTEGLTDDDAVPEPPAEPVTQPGDLWLLGAYWECADCGKRYDYDAGKAMVDAGKECACGTA